jgi:hypothetical protein
VRWEQFVRDLGVTYMNLTGDVMVSPMQPPKATYLGMKRADEGTNWSGERGRDGLAQHRKSRFAKPSDVLSREGRENSAGHLRVPHSPHD